MSDSITVDAARLPLLLAVAGRWWKLAFQRNRTRPATSARIGRKTPKSTTRAKSNHASARLYRKIACFHRLPWIWKTASLRKIS
jgi:hypothetical protein